MCLPRKAMICMKLQFFIWNKADVSYVTTVNILSRISVEQHYT